MTCIYLDLWGSHPFLRPPKSVFFLRNARKCGEAAVEMRWEDLGEGGGFGGSGSPDFRNVTGTDSAKHANLTKPLGITWHLVGRIRCLNFCFVVRFMAECYILDIFF